MKMFRLMKGKPGIMSVPATGKVETGEKLEIDIVDSNGWCAGNITVIRDTTTGSWNLILSEIASEPPVVTISTPEADND
jgi:hypothetical protein